MPEEVPDQIQMAVELMVSQIENTITEAMEETIVEVIPEHRQWAHALAARIFNNLSHSGWGFTLNMGTGNEN